MSKKNMWIDVAKQLTMLSQIGLNIVVCVFGCGFIGFFIDRKLDTKPIFSFIMIAIGLMSAGLSTYKHLIEYTRKKKR